MIQFLYHLGNLTALIVPVAAVRRDDESGGRVNETSSGGYVFGGDGASDAFGVVSDLDAVVDGAAVGAEPGDEGGEFGYEWIVDGCGGGGCGGRGEGGGGE